MTNPELLQALDRLKATKIAVATGGARIQAVQKEFAEEYDAVARELAERQLPNPLPYRDLWAWYGRWSSGDMPSWQSRRNFINGLFNELVPAIQSRSVMPRPHEPTGWARVDRQRNSLNVCPRGELLQQFRISPGKSIDRLIYIADGQQSH